MTVTREVLHPGPITTQELRVINGRVGTLNTADVQGHAPYTLRLVTIDVRSATNGYVISETWELPK